MPINIVNTTKEEKDFKFVQNRTSILHTNSTNKVTFNHVNAIVRSPKVGDVMCITRYTDENDSLLPADKQKVIWIDGLSINPKQLSQKYEPVGICLKTYGNKAMVRYKQITSYIKWGEKNRWKVNKTDFGGSSDYSVDIGLSKFYINLDNGSYIKTFSHDYTSYFEYTSSYDFISWLNVIFEGGDGGSYFNGCTVQVLSYADESKVYNVTSQSGFPSDGIVVINTPIYNYLSIGAQVGSAGNPYYRNADISRINGLEIEKSGYTAYRKTNFLSKWPGVCKSKYYDWCYTNGTTLNENMSSINQVNHPVSYACFNSNYCKILRDTFATYDEYIEANMVKLPCGAGGYVVDSPSGKENTYKLADCKLDDGTVLYPAANLTASINVNAPKLGAGNWWLPSAAEMAEIMRDITYDTNSWETNPDIINSVLLKLNSFDSEWSMLSAYGYKWTSSMAKTDTLHDIPNNPAMGDVIIYRGDLGLFDISQFNYEADAMAITIYEF